jgi:hypothetical protein
MPEAATGTLVGNTIHLDAPLNLPDETRVSLTVLPLTPERAEALAAWEATKARLREHPIHGDGKRFTRDELHERG